MLESIVVGVPTLFSLAMLGFVAVTDPIESTIDHVGVAQVFEEAGYPAEHMRVKLHSDVEEIGQVSSSWGVDKRVRVSEMESGVEALANSLFDIGEVFESGLRALDIIDNVVEVYFMSAPGSFVVSVHIRDAFDGSFIAKKRFAISSSESGEALTPEIVVALNEAAARYIIETSEPFLYAAYLYREAKEGGGSLEEALRYIDDHFDEVRGREVAGMHNLRGLIASDLGVYAYAVREFMAALEARPYFAPAYFNLGRIWHEVGDYERAMRLYRRALAFDGHAVGHLYLAEALLATGRDEEALAELRRARRISRDFARIYEVEGEILARRGDALGARRMIASAARAREAQQYQSRFLPF